MMGDLMFRRILRRLRPSGRDEAGIAMIMVMGAITVLSLLVTAALGYALQAQPQARHDQDWNAALAAAQSGVDDYVARLNQNDSYYTSVDCTNIAEKGPKSGTNTCGWTAATAAGWQNVVPGQPTQGQFHYDVDASTILSQGTVRVTSTGKMRNASRTIQVLVSRGGSTQFLYYTDFEDADPGNQVAYGAPGNGNPICGSTGPTTANYYWEGGRSLGSSPCVEITFVTGDSLDGAVHFNDTPLVSGTPTFKKGYETADANCKTAVAGDDYAKCWRSNSATPNFNGNPPTYAAPLNLPDNSAAFASYPGCDYTGDTRIKFNSDGTMTVWDKGSIGTTVGAGCGTPATLAGSSGQTVNVPTDQTIYVANAATQAKCTTGQVGDGIPLAGDDNMNLSTFYCGQGNVYIEGTLKGRVTVAAQNNVIVTGDLLLSTTTAGAAPTGLGHAGPGREQLGGQLPPGEHLRHQPHDDQRPLDLRVDPDAAAQLLGAVLRRWRQAGHAARTRLDRPAVARHRRYRRRVGHRLPQGLQLRLPAHLRVASVLPAVDQRGMGREDDRRAEARLLSPGAPYPYGVPVSSSLSTMLTALAALLGLFVGSFLNVVIYRVPKGESVVRPRSRCPGCGTQLAEYDNVPVVSWLVLRGRCRTCREPISVRYPVVEALTALVFGLMAWHFGWVWVLPAFLYLGAMGIALAAIDIDTQRLPDVIVKPSYAVAAVLLGALRPSTGTGAPSSESRSEASPYGRSTGCCGSSIPRAWAGATSSSPASSGCTSAGSAGDRSSSAASSGSCSAASSAPRLMLSGRAGRKTKIPYGPYMIVGTFLAVFFGQAISDWYGGILGR